MNPEKTSSIPMVSEKEQLERRYQFLQGLLETRKNRLSYFKGLLQEAEDDMGEFLEENPQFI